jgi:hypothetical protein
MRYRLAIPAPPPRFRMMPGWRQPKCIGDTTATATIIIVGIAGTTIIITVTTTTTATTGTAGKRGGLAHEQARFIAGLFSSRSSP